VGKDLFKEPAKHLSALTAPAIIVLAYKRHHSLQRLLNSLKEAHYAHDGIPLVISLDKGASAKVRDIANSYEWVNGPKEIIEHKEKLGTRGHVLFAGDLSQKYGSIIVLEDDLGVSPWFYNYTRQALAFYANDNNIAGISLYGYQVTESNFHPFKPDTKGWDIYLMQFPSSWGQAWTAAQWQGFRSWLSQPTTKAPELPQFVKDWSGSSWKREFLTYMLATDKYFVYPKTSLSTNYGDRGVNFSLDIHLYRVPLETREKEYHFGSINEGVTIMNAWFGAGETRKQHEQRYLIEDAEYQLRKREGSTESYWWFKLRYLFYNYCNVLRKKLLAR
jgi:hypothetical protein